MFWLSMPWARLVEGITYKSELSFALLSPIVLGLPEAVIAIGVGGLTAYLVESTHPRRWVLVPAVLYAVLAFTSVYWAEPPGFFERLEQLVGAAFTSGSCLAGSLLVGSSREERAA